MADTKLTEYLIELCKDGNESWRQASMRAGLDPGAISSYVRGTQPSPSSCLRLADHFGVDPNRLLGLAGHPPLKNLPAWGEGRDLQLEEIKKRLAILTDTVRREVVPYHGEWVWLPLIGTVPAGHPEWRGQEEAEEHFPCAADAIQDRERAYAIRVVGNSMVDRGILDQDIVFLDEAREPRPGNVVIAATNDEVVLRIYKEDAKGACLVAANSGYPKLRLRDGKILGVVVGSYRERP